MGKSKKELDRDMMFRKIMPALADNPFSSLVADPEPESDLEMQETVPIAASVQESPPILQPELQMDETDSTPEPASTCLVDPHESVSSSISTVMPEQASESRSISHRQVEFPTPPSEDLPEDDLFVLRTRLFGRSNTNPDTVSTINLMESLVLQHLDEVIQRFNCCRCDRCRRDIAAFALNQLPAQYIVADPANANSIEPRIPKKDVLNALVKAVLQIRTHPRH